MTDEALLLIRSLLNVLFEEHDAEWYDDDRIWAAQKAVDDKELGL